MRSWSGPEVPGVAGRSYPLWLFNTASGRQETISPRSTARMYVCGITPYDSTHLGHAATYVTFDIINRLWRDAGITVHYVQNVTDIDDPLLERAQKNNQHWNDLSQQEIARFRQDMSALRVLPPTDFVGAVESIPGIVDAIGKMLADGVAYRIDDKYPDIYFDHLSAKKFGYISHYDESTMDSLLAERGGDPDRIGKKHRLDPLLWRVARPNEPAWPSAIGAGRPGWHIECSVIALEKLGAGFDIQGGGEDLIFPHHEYSAAHAESISGEFPFAQHYVHTGMIGVDGAKMSKSRGNLVFVSELLEAGADPSAIRLALLDAHYRDDRMWTTTILSTAITRLHRWRTAAELSAGPAAEDTVAQLRRSLSDDLQTAAALIAIDTWATEALTTGGSDPTAPRLIRDAVDALLGVRL